MSAVKYSASFEIQQPVDAVFPLFSAEGEKVWVPGWDYENIMESSAFGEDCVFVTRRHDHASTDAIWLVKKYSPDQHLVQLYRVEPGEKVGVIEVKCFERTESLTEVRVTYEYIGLSTSGDSFIADFSQSLYEAFVAEWKELLVTYFEGRR